MNFVGIILVGGKSSRMGSDKGLLSYKGKPLVKYSIEALKNKCQHTMLVGENSAYDKFKLPRFEDDTPNLGPLGGIQKGLRMSEQEWNIILSTDIPHVNEWVVNALIEKPVNGLIRVF